MTPVEVAYLAGWRLVRALPRPVAATAFRLAADRAHRGKGAGVARLATNLRRVVGPDLPDAEFDELVRRGVRSYARYWMEMFRLPKLRREQLLAGFRLDRAELLAADVAAGRGAVIALPHAGNWDAAGAWVGAMGWPLTTVMERLRPERIYQRFVDYRERLGMEILPARGGSRPPLEVLAERLGQGHVVPLLADRDLSARGVPVRFFGAQTRMPAGPALLAIRTGAPLYVVSMWYEPDAACGSLHGPIDLPEPGSAPLDQRVRLITQRIADRLADGVARHPEDWHMLQRMWTEETGTPVGARPGEPAPAADLAVTAADLAGTAGVGWPDRPPAGPGPV